MIIFQDRMPVAKFPRRVKIRNTIWPILYGVNVASGDGEPEFNPVYIPFVRFHPGDGQLVIELMMWKENGIVILLFKRWPFLYVTRDKGITLE